MLGATGEKRAGSVRSRSLLLVLRPPPERFRAGSRQRPRLELLELPHVKCHLVLEPAYRCTGGREFCLALHEVPYYAPKQRCVGPRELIGRCWQCSRGEYSDFPLGHALTVARARTRPGEGW